MIKVILCFWALISFDLFADDMRPASLTITATTNSEFEVVLKVPIKNGVKQALSIIFSDNAQIVGLKRTHIINNAHIEYSTFQRSTGLEGLEISIGGLKGVNGDVLMRIIDDKQQTVTAVLNTEQPKYQVNKLISLSAFDTAITYIELGIEHILVGLDHLLFVACLVYISGTYRKLLLTVTGFTIAHSITLFLSTTGLFIIPIQPVEAVIALSIIFLAWEIAKNNKRSLSLRYPVLVSSSFGLLHGFGFAAVLAEIGLPESEKLLALISFNIGVEIGQILFILAIFILFKIMTSIVNSLTIEKLRLPVSYVCGIVASIWMIERLSAF